jgi:hypothetical protein
LLSPLSSPLSLFPSLSTDRAISLPPRNCFFPLFPQYFPSPLLITVDDVVVAGYPACFGFSRFPVSFSFHALRYSHAP